MRNGYEIVAKPAADTVQSVILKEAGGAMRNVTQGDDGGGDAEERRGAEKTQNAGIRDVDADRSGAFR